jgi:hypothetical protein
MSRFAPLNGSPYMRRAERTRDVDVAVFSAEMGVSDCLGVKLAMAWHGFRKRPRQRVRA